MSLEDEIRVKTLFTSYSSSMEVHAEHIPTGIMVICSKHRAIHRNRDECIKEIRKKLEERGYWKK